jgi:glycine/serine hydroxymethyltransferase
MFKIIYKHVFFFNRYYGGNRIIDQVGILAQKRALKAFNLDPGG